MFPFCVLLMFPLCVLLVSYILRLDLGRDMFSHPYILNIIELYDIDQNGFRHQAIA